MYFITFLLDLRKTQSTFTSSVLGITHSEMTWNRQFLRFCCCTIICVIICEESSFDINVECFRILSWQAVLRYSIYVLGTHSYMCVRVYRQILRLPIRRLSPEVSGRSPTSSLIVQTTLQCKLLTYLLTFLLSLYAHPYFHCTFDIKYRQLAFRNVIKN